MGKVACIYFVQSNILVFKDNLKQTKIKNIYTEEKESMGNAYYNVYIAIAYDKLTDRLWIKLEDLLLKLGVTYVVWPEDTPEPLFEDLEVVTGNLLRRLLSYHTFKYIGKYSLVKRAPMYMNIGVVAGRFNDTLDVIVPLLPEITSLTIITEMPSMYREVASEIYESHRLKVKVAHPQKIVMENLDIIYDVNPSNHYMNMCNPKSIYIDLLGYLDRKHLTFKGVLPSIWNGFDILCDGYEITIPLMEAFYYSEGFSKRNLRKKIKDLDISISRVYTLGKLTMSV